jgi:hypothetical protein
MERLDLSRRADSCPTGPAASSWNASRLDVFVEGTNGALYQKIDWLVGLASLGGSLTSKMTEMLLLIASIELLSRALAEVKTTVYEDSEARLETPRHSKRSFRVSEM